MSDTYNQDALNAAHVKIAVLEANALNRDMQIEALVAAVRDLTAQVAGISAALAEAKGGWRTLMWLGGAAATIGSLATWFFTHTFTINPR